MLIATRFADTVQIHRVAAPMAARTQLSFEAEPVPGASWAPKRGDVMVVQKDVGGSEFFQLFTMKDGELSLLTDGKSRNTLGSWSQDGSLVGYSSTRRNGADTDLYVMDPRDPKSDRLVAQVKPIAYGAAQYAPDGTLWVTSDEGSDFQRLGTLDTATGKFTARTSEKWDVDTFDIAPDGKFIAYVVNEAGTDRVRVLEECLARRGELGDSPGAHGQRHAGGAFESAQVVGNGGLGDAEGAGGGGDDERVIVTQYDMTSLEKAGMLKMDFLGLTTLTVISDTLASIKQRTGETVVLEERGFTDEKTYQLLRAGRTGGVFQFESALATDSTTWSRRTPCSVRVRSTRACTTCTSGASAAKSLPCTRCPSSSRFCRTRTA